METLRLVNSYGDVAYGKAQQQPLQQKSGRTGLTEGSGAQGAGRAAGGSAGGANSRTPGTYGPSVTGRTAPTTSSTGRSAPAKALTPTESARIYAARKELAKMVGWSGTAASGISYKVTKALSGKPSLLVQAKGTQGFRTVVDADTRAWLAVAEAALAAYRAKSVFRPSAGSGKPVAPSTSTTTTTTDTSAGAGAGETSTDTGSGSSGGASTPAWYSQPYLNEMLAISGWTGPSFNMPSVTLTVKSSTLDGVAAPVIGVASSTGAVDVTPIMAEWSAYASNVVASKAEDDQRKASGTPAPFTGGGGGSTRVTSDTSSSGYNIWSSDSVPSSESAPASTGPASSGGGGSSMRVVENEPAPTFVPSTEAAPTSEAVTLVSEDIETQEGEQGFFAKNKWYVAGGAVALLGGYAYMHRMNPTKYPLPDYLSKLVR